MTVVLDTSATSAIAAVVFGEPDAEAYLSVMLAHVGDLQLSAGTRAEVGIAVEARHGPEGARDLDVVLERLQVGSAWS